MNSMNKKILDKICESKEFAIEIYDELSLNPFDTFCYQECFDDVLITNEDDLFFIAHKCRHTNLLEKMWKEEESEITHQLTLMDDRDIAMKLCKFTVLNEGNGMSTLCFSLKKIFSFLPKNRIFLLKMELIQHFLKISDKDFFPTLIDNNVLNIRDFIIFSKKSEYRNETIINILNHYEKIETLDITNKIKEIESDFEQEIQGFKIGKNIKNENNITSLTTLLKINKNIIMLKPMESELLLKVAKYWNNTELFSLINKIKIASVFNDKYKAEKIIKVRL